MGAPHPAKKMLFALLHDERVTTSFTPEEREAIARHVPWTRRVEQGKTIGPDGVEIDLTQEGSARGRPVASRKHEGPVARGAPTQFGGAARGGASTHKGGSL